MKARLCIEDVVSSVEFVEVSGREKGEAYVRVPVEFMRMLHARADGKVDTQAFLKMCLQLSLEGKFDVAHLERFLEEVE